MPFALILIGILLVVVAYQGTQSQFFTLLKGDFTGTGNFAYWVLSIMVIGAVGYIPRMKGLSDAFLALVILVLFISAGNKGFFASFNSQLSGGTTTGGSRAPTTSQIQNSISQFGTGAGL